MNNVRPRESSALPKVMQQVCESQCQKSEVPAPRTELDGLELQGLLIQTNFCKVLCELSCEIGPRGSSWGLSSLDDAGQKCPLCNPLLCTRGTYSLTSSKVVCWMKFHFLKPNCIFSLDLHCTDEMKLLHCKGKKVLSLEVIKIISNGVAKLSKVIHVG